MWLKIFGAAWIILICVWMTVQAGEPRWIRGSLVNLGWFALAGVAALVVALVVYGPNSI